ncbi:MAG: sigma-70 family RNA polymerase sigma factor [Bacteroidota bacterium]
MKLVDKTQILQLSHNIRIGGIPERRATNLLYEHFRYMVQQGQQKFRLSDCEAESAYHQAIHSLIESLRSGTFRGESTLKTYLHRAFKNQCINSSKKSSRTQENAPLEDCPQIGCENPTPDRHLMVREKVEMVLHCLGRINEKAQTILWGAAYHGYSSQEIAQQTGLKNAATVDVLKRRYRKQLLKMIQEPNIYA